MKKKSTQFRTIFLLFFLCISQFAYNQAPNWIWNSPFAVIPSSVSGGGLSLYAMIDGPGFINYVVLPHGSPAPDSAQILAGQDGIGASGIAFDEIQIFTGDYLKGFYSIEPSAVVSGTEYDIYFVATDDANNLFSNVVKLDVTTNGSSALTYWNGDFEQWTDSLFQPLYYINWRQTLGVASNKQSYSRGLGESGYGFKTVVTDSTITEKRILILQNDPFPFGFTTGATSKYHVSMRLKANRAKAFSVAFNQWDYYTDFSSGSGSPIPGTNTFTTIDTIKSTNWETYSADFTMTSANRFKPRWNINKTATVHNKDSIIIDNFYIKLASDTPIWWNGSPSVSNIKFNKFDVNARIDEPGIIYYVLVPQNATAPSSAEVLAGTAHGGPAILHDTINASIGFNTYSKTLSGLSETTNYDLYLVAQNKESSPNAQTAVTKVSAVTSAFPGPFANAGSDIRAISTYTVQLDGTGSIGTNLTYTWSPPAGITLSSNSASKPTFTAPSVTDSADYKIALIVQDSVNVSTSDTIVIRVIQDYKPIANAGGNKSVLPGATSVALDGSSSYDPNGKPLTYTWTIPPGITVNKSDTAIITFNAPSSSSQKLFKFYLVVNDGKLDSYMDSAFLYIKPTAIAGSDIWAISSYTVNLDGTGSIGSGLTYNWTPPVGITLSNNSAPQPTFTAPSVADSANYKIALVVNDGTNNSLSDTVVVHVIQDYKPIANAGGNKSVLPGTTNISLDGSSSFDPNGKPITYAWTIPSGITLTAGSPTTSTITFNAPSSSVQKEFKFYLVVNDGKLDSYMDSALLFIKPTANAGGNIWAISSYQVQLDGTQSIGSSLTYSWTPPAGISLSSNTASMPTFTAPAVTDSATYKIALVVFDGTNISLSDTVRVHVIQDYKPIADAGGNKSVLPGTTNISLDGSSSYDPNGKPITYAWTIPSGITLTAGNPTTSIITFNAPSSSIQKEFKFYLVVNDGKLDSYMDSALLFIKPTANAGGNIWALSGYPVQLDGTNSIGSGLTYNWTPPAGISLSSNTASMPTFTAPSVTDSATYKIALVVNDGTNNSLSDTVMVHVIQDYKPIANAGGNKSVLPGATNISLDGSSSNDPNGKPITYAWTIPSGITLTAGNPTSSIITLNAPSSSIQKEFAFYLIVNDGKLDSYMDSALLFIKPTSNAGGNIWAISGYPVQLDGTNSIGTGLTYSWTPPVGISLSSNTASMPTFTAPAVTDSATYKIALVVNDGTNNSLSDTVRVHVIQDYMPIADAGGNKSVLPGTVNISLDGSSSNDPNGKPITYSWTIPSGITLTAGNPASSIISFNAPSPLVQIKYKFILVVNDGKNNSIPDTAVITVSAFNIKPLANAGTDQGVNNGVQVTLNGSLSSDSNGDNLTYHWTAPAGVIINNPDTIQISFVSPSPARTTVYPFILVVNDGLLNSDPDTVNITVNVLNVKPLANAGNNQTVNAATLVTLSGSLSTDSNGDPLMYHWTVPSGIAISNADTIQISFIAPSPIATKVYPIILTVNDGILNSNPDTANITVNVPNVKPLANAGNNQTVNAAAVVILNGSSSNDPNGDMLTYHWNVPAGITVNNLDSVQISFVAPSTLATTVYPIILTVNDGTINSNGDTVKITVLGTVGIHPVTIRNVQLYPNPMVSNLNIRLSESWSMNSTMKIFNAIGNLIIEKEIFGHEYLLDVSSLNSGVYIVEINDGVNSIHRKIIKR